MSIIVNSPLFKIILKELEEDRDSNAVDIAKDLREMSPVALDVIERTMYKSKSERLRFKAAESILDRAGYGPVNKTTLDVKGAIDVHHGMSEEELKSMILERVRRMEQEKEEKQKLEDEAKTITITWEEVKPDECSTDERPLAGVASWLE